MTVDVPSRPHFVSNMIHPKVMHDQAVPVVLLQLKWDMPGHIVVDLSEILRMIQILALLSMNVLYVHERT